MSTLYFALLFIITLGNLALLVILFILYRQTILYIQERENKIERLYIEFKSQKLSIETEVKEIRRTSEIRLKMLDAFSKRLNIVQLKGYNLEKKIDKTASRNFLTATTYEER